MHIICIDPGHGGDDGGDALASGTAEKDVVLALAKRLGNACREGQWQVSLTRIDDRDVPVEQRSFRANRTGATCFVSLHTCGGAVGLPRPAEGDASPLGTRVVYQGGRGQGLALATALQAAVVECGMPDGGVVATPRLDLLRWCSIPAVLLELRASPGEENARVLESAEGQQRLAQVLATALMRIFP